MPNVITREAAHVAGLKKYFTGEGCGHGHVAERYVSTGGCVACLQRYRASYAVQVLDHDLVAWSPVHRFQIPKGLTPAQQHDLEATLQLWVVEWAKARGISVPATAQTTIQKMVKYRLERLTAGVSE